MGQSEVLPFVEDDAQQPTPLRQMADRCHLLVVHPDVDEAFQ
ncbi:hypothetical protein L2X98_30925 [Microbacterium elymi]|uniref:Uncharacterized protein n=1 Tax=Microbacterium elymi TaxID=2909587 RepID=A0ABY5NIB7_9MICO|nr:hypothetical protein [Microbacterium elymi]UUT34841.1 hypothetical protein L2X98_30925 [Microbacterium elymi]